MESIETVGEEPLAAPTEPAILDVDVEEGYRVHEYGIGEGYLTSQRLIQRIRPRVMIPEDGREPFYCRRVIADAGCERRDALSCSSSAIDSSSSRLSEVACPCPPRGSCCSRGASSGAGKGSNTACPRSAKVDRPAEQLVVPLVLIRVLVELREQVRVDVLLRVRWTRRHDDVGPLTTLQRRAYETVHLC